MSLPEVLLWQRLKGSPDGTSFRKQHPIGAYRADFYCAAAKLVIEIDGIAHDMGDRPARDEARNRTLEAKGYRIVRVLASEVLRNPDQVADALVSHARSSPGRGGGPSAEPMVEGALHPHGGSPNPLHHPSDGPPPRPGEDLL